MKSSNQSAYLLIAAVIALLLGLTNYLLFNPHIVLFHWLGMHPVKSILIQNPVLSLFFRGYFSDIAWCIALCLVVSYLSKHKYLSDAGKLLILSIPFLSEIGQYLSIIPGTFDWFDMLTYLVVITIYSCISPVILSPFNYKKIKPNILSVGVAFMFLLMVFGSATPRKTVYRPIKEPCVRHAALMYSPVLVQINIDGNYVMKDLTGVQGTNQVYLMSALAATNPGKYQLAQGVTPNLNIYITYNTDGYLHYGATVKFYVYDDNTWFSMPSNYVDISRLLDDVAARMNAYVTNGWSHGCP
jgi:hypothetical protein